MATLISNPNYSEINFLATYLATTKPIENNELKLWSQLNLKREKINKIPVYLLNTFTYTNIS